MCWFYVCAWINAVSDRSIESSFYSSAQAVMRKVNQSNTWVNLKRLRYYSGKSNDRPYKEYSSKRLILNVIKEQE